MPLSPKEAPTVVVKIVLSALVATWAAATVAVVTHNSSKPAKHTATHVAGLKFLAQTNTSANGNGNGNGQTLIAVVATTYGNGAPVLAPGDSFQRLVDLNYTGNNPISSITLTASANPNTLLTSNSPLALQLTVDLCPAGWTPTAGVYTCSTTPSLVYSGIAGANGSTLNNLSVSGKGTTDHLRFTFSLPSANTDYARYHGLATGLTYTFSASKSNNGNGH